MSNEAIKWALGMTLGNGMRKAVLLAVSCYADPVTRQATCGQERLARELEFSDKSIRRALADLEDMGLISRKRRFRSDGKPTSDRITVNLDNKTYHRTGRPPVTESGGEIDHRTNRPVVPPDSVTTGQTDHRSLSPSPPVTVTGNILGDIPGELEPDGSNLPAGKPADGDGEHLAPRKKRVRPSATALPESYPADAFDQFWNLYPLHKGKAAAQKNFIKAAWKVSFEDLIAGLYRYVSECRGKDPSKIKWAQGWLTEERWNDEYQTQGQINDRQSSGSIRANPAARPQGTGARVLAAMGIGPEHADSDAEEERRVPGRSPRAKGGDDPRDIDLVRDDAGVYRAPHR